MTATRESASPEPRSWSVAVVGFDFSRVRVRARTRGQARMIVARAFADAGWGSIREGLMATRSVRLDPSAESLRLVYSDAPRGIGLLAEFVP